MPCAITLEVSDADRESAVACLAAIDDARAGLVRAGLAETVLRLRANGRHGVEHDVRAPSAHLLLAVEAALEEMRAEPALMPPPGIDEHAVSYDQKGREGTPPHHRFLLPDWSSPVFAEPSRAPRILARARAAARLFGPPPERKTATADEWRAKIVLYAPEGARLRHLRGYDGFGPDAAAALAAAMRRAAFAAAVVDIAAVAEVKSVQPPDNMQLAALEEATSTLPEAVPFRPTRHNDRLALQW